MLRPRRSLLAALLVLSVPPAFAVTLTVNTTTDDNADNSLCSLREAVTYVNKDRPVAGYQGCKPAANDTSTADTINLPANSSAYVIKDTAILIERKLTIAGTAITGDTVTTVKTEGSTPHRAFVISADITYLVPTQPTPDSGLMAAPQLDPTDPGKTGNNLTTNQTPPIIGTIASASVDKLVTLYAISSDGLTHVQVGTATVPVGSTSWNITPLLTPRLQKLVYTVRDASEAGLDETNPVYSNQLNLAIYPTEVIAVEMQQLVIQGCSPDLASPVNCASNVDATLSQTSANGLTYTNVIAGTADNGGLIYTNVPLTLSKVKLSQGYAAGKGGGIYADADSNLAITSAEIRKNGAPDGAGLYIKPNSLALSGSLLTENKATAGAVVSIESDAPAGSATQTSYLFNITVSGNTGTALSVRKDVVVNNATIVNNSKGIEFNGTVAELYNSILAGNPLTGTALDCSGVSQAKFGYNLVQTSDGCQTPGSATGMQTISGSGTGKLMVDDTSECTSQPTGLLCRLADNGGDFPTHLPRILPGTTSYDNSPIFNQGSSAKSDDTSCETADQRGKSRSYLDCDIGAVELQETTSTASSGNVITFGQTYTQTLATDMGDEELLPAAMCPATAPATGPVFQYTPTAKGCPWIETMPGKGTLVFNADGSYTYRPSSNYYGRDDFTVRVITTYSNLQPLNVNKSRLIDGTILSQPASGISSSSVGATGLLLLAGLAVLGFFVRGRRG